ncbi:efflux RND transporter permease subunit, partial [bacterium]|nr:efflux RND transporter permease subunit [bacterium]
DFIKRARASGSSRWESIVEAGCMRLRPILLTSITTILGVLPLAMGWGGVSASWGPMAAALAWGLAFATILTLFVIPSLFSIVDDIRARAGKLDVEGERHPSQECAFSNGLAESENGLTLLGDAATQPPRWMDEPGGGGPHGGDS